MTYAYHQNKSKPHGNTLYTAIQVAEWRKIKREKNLKSVKDLAALVGVNYQIVQRLFALDSQGMLQ